MKEDGRLCLKTKRRKEYAQTRGRARDRGAADGGAAGVGGRIHPENPRGAGGLRARLCGRQTFAEARLDEARTIVAEQENGCRNEIEIADGRVRMKASTCQNQLCVEQGWMEPGKVSKRSMGAHIVCLPNAVDVQLFASGADAPDA